MSGEPEQASILPFQGLRVVHAANFQLNKDGSVFFNCDQKIHHGLIQNGCYAYPFSINDRARMLTWTGRKEAGAGQGKSGPDQDVRECAALICWSSATLNT